MPDTRAPLTAWLAWTSGIALLAATAFFAFMMSPRGMPIGGCVAVIGLLAAVLAAGMARIELLLPPGSRGAAAAHELAVMALMVASLMIAANGIPLLIALLRTGP